MAVVDELQIIVNAKVDKAVADLKKTQAATNKTTTSAKNLIKSLLPIAGAAAGFAVLTRLTVASAKAASDAQEIIGKYNVVFRSVADQSQAMADQLASDFDLAGSSARELLGNTGDLLTGFGLTAEEALNLSDTTNRLAMDLASFTNAQGGAAAVSAALTSAFTGEREALKTYGIVISEAMVQTELLEQAQKGLTFATEQEAKIQATLAIAQRQSTNAIGDYARTSDSTANVSRKLNEVLKESQEIFGEFVNEGVTPAKSALADFISEMNTAARQSKELSGALDLVYGRSDESAMSAKDALGALSVGYDEINKRINEQKRYIDANSDSQDRRIQSIVTARRSALADLESEKKGLEERIELVHRQVTLEGRAAGVRKAAADALTEEAANEAARVEQSILNQQRLQEEYNNRAYSIKEWQIAARDAYNSADEAFFANVDARAAALTKEQKLVNDLASSVESGLAGAFTSAFGAVGEALVEGENAMTAFAKAALMGFASMLDAIAAQLAGYAILGLFTTGGTLSGPALAGAAAAATAAGVTRATASGFQAGTGGDFVVPEGFQGDSYPINVSSGERVRVDNEDQVNNSGSGTPIIIQIDSSPIYRGMLKASQNGVALMDTRAMVRT